MGQDTYLYHNPNIAKFYRDASDSELKKLKEEGWVDTPAKLKPPKKADELQFKK
jgi:hypothetical protein